MASAASTLITEWILLLDARALVISVYQDLAEAQRWLQKRIEEGDIPWRYWAIVRGTGPLRGVARA